MESLGAQLKAAREQKHVSVSQAARETRISANHLENFEAGRYKSLPGGVYNRAFLKMYSEYLGLDPKAMLDKYHAETSVPTEKPPKAGGVKAGSLEPSFAPHPILIWSVMLLISVVALYFSRNWVSDVFSPYFTRRPAPTQTLVKPEVQAPAQQEPAQPAAGPASGEQTAAAASSGAEVPLPPQLPGTIRLSLQITQRCWVSVTSDGNRVLVKLLEPGDTQTFDAVESLYIILGNAGGVRANINGKPARPFGKDGEVVRVAINAQNVNELLEQPDSLRNARQ
jgi:cytoskeletal protein RodZ